MTNPIITTPLPQVHTKYMLYSVHMLGALASTIDIEMCVASFHTIHTPFDCKTSHLATAITDIYNNTIDSFDLPSRKPYALQIWMTIT